MWAWAELGLLLLLLEAGWLVGCMQMKMLNGIDLPAATSGYLIETITADCQ